MCLTTFVRRLFTLSMFVCVFASADDEAAVVVMGNNVSGGGFQGDVTISSDGLTVYSSADVSGVLKSTDGGLQFDTFNEGLKSPKVASLAITPDNDQILYAGTGDKGGSGGLYRSINGGESWALTGEGADAQFAGNHSADGDPVPGGHPRSNGDLIVVDHGMNPATHLDDIVIAGTYKNGVRIFERGGDELAAVVNGLGFVRSVAFDPALPNIVYAAIQFEESAENGIYRIDYTDLSAPVSTLEYEAFRPEGLLVLSNGHVYGAIGKEGIVRFNGTSWVEKIAGLSTNNELRQWTAVAGYVKGNSDVVYAATNNLGGNASGSNYSSVWRTVNGGNDWLPLVDANTNVDDKIYGHPHDWWYRVDAFPQAGLGRKSSVVSSVAVARGAWPNVVSDDIIFVSGRGGLWRSDNGGESWKPAVNNMQVTANNGVAVNPNDPAQVVVANTDYVLLETRSQFDLDDVSRDKPGGAESRGYDVEFDVTADQLILGAGDRDTNDPGGGEVYLKAASSLGNASGNDWINTNLQAATAANNGRVRAVTYGYHDGVSDSTQIVLAAVEGEGVFRRHEGTWTKSSGIAIGATNRSNFVWPDNGASGVVYLLDLSEGLYRSVDGGQNWSDIWPGLSLTNNDFFNTGYITADDDDPTTLYVSMQGRPDPQMGSTFGVYRMTGADTRIFGAPGTAGIVDIGSHSNGLPIQRPGPLVVGPAGNLWVTQQQNSPNAIAAGLFVMENPATAISFEDVTTNAYRNIAIKPSGIDASADGHIYISQNGSGVVKLKRACVFGVDTDGDCIDDASDNCVLVANPDQRDADADGYGNACDADLSQDCLVNAIDLGIFRSLFFSANVTADFNGDGVVNLVDLGIMRSAFFEAPGPSSHSTACN